MRYFLIFLVLIQTRVNGQNPGPMLQAMGSGGTAIPGIWSLQQNPAGISELKRAKFAIAYQQHVLGEDVSTQTALFAIPVRGSVIGVSFNSYGFDEYKEQQAGFFYSKSFGESFRMAIGLKYHQLNISDYGSAKTYSVDVGFQLKVTNEFTIATHVANPGRSRYNNLADSSLPVELSIGGSCMLSDRILMIADIRKVLNYPLDVMTGIEFNLVRWFSLRGGVSAYPFKQYAGFGIKYNKIQVDVAVASHPSLGYSPQIALGYEF